MSVRLFVGNLSYDVTESDLRDFFQPVGQLSTVILPMDRDTGKPRGFAFVEFVDQKQAAEAVSRFNNQPLKDRNIVINEARARESRPGMGSAPRSRGNFASRPPAGDTKFEFDPNENARTSRSERRNRNFTADAKPARKKKQRSGSRKESGAKKGPIRERGGGQFFGDVEDDDYYNDDSDDEK